MKLNITKFGFYGLFNNSNENFSICNIQACNTCKGCKAGKC